MDDNFWHNNIGPQYIEWWYVDARLNDNYYLAGSFGIWGNLKRPRSLVIRSDFLLTTPNGNTIDFGNSFDLSSFKASTTKCHVQLGNNVLENIEDKYNLRLCNGENNIFLDLSFRPACAGYKHIHYFDKNRCSFFAWVVPAPFAKFEGVLEKNGKKIYLIGSGYHDHNWASVSLDEVLGGWVWGRLHGDNDVLVFAKLQGKTSTLFSSLAWIKQNEMHSSKYQYLSCALETTDMKITTNALDWDLMVTNSQIEMKLAIEKKDDIAKNTKSPGYKRLISYGTGEIIHAGASHEVTGSIFHEFKELS